MDSGKTVKNYKNMLDCCSKIYQKEGLQGFYQGNLSNFWRGITSALVLVFYDEFQRMYLKKDTKKA